MHALPSTSGLPTWLSSTGEDEEKGETKSPASSNDAKTSAAEAPATERTALTGVASQDERPMDEEEVVHRGPVLTFFVAISALSIIDALLLGAAHAASLYSFATRVKRDSRGAVDVALRGYGLVFCLAICCIEFELGPTARSSVVARFWSLRGLFYALVGLLALDDAENDERRRREDADIPAWRDDVIPYLLYLRCTAVAILSLGLLYLALGLCCCKHWKDRLALDHRKQLAKAQLRAAIIAELAAKRTTFNNNNSNNNNKAQSNADLRDAADD